MCKQERFPLDEKGQRSIPDNEETNSGATNINNSLEGGRTHGLSTVANEAVSAVILVERSGRQTPIHYVIRTLQGAKINYPPMEKLALALVHVARWLRRYFQGQTIRVIIDKPISRILNNREAMGRLAKWGVELKAYGIKYTPRSAIKGQVLTDFLADTMAEDSPAQAKTDGQDNALTEGEGLILIDPEGVEYSYTLRLNFANSNNDAEYEALLAGLKIATKMNVEKMHVFVDSKLVANHVEGSYEAKGEKTRKYKEKALEMIRNFSDFQIRVLIEELNERSVDTAEVNAIIKEATRTWMMPIQEYIEKGILPEDVTKARTIREKARNYTIDEGVLYQKSYLGLLLRCIGPQQAKYGVPATIITDNGNRR
ncbi:reverse transcriptase domain-containing protein [Tanacetum coccineum]